MAPHHMYVVLPSNSSMEYYPDNTLANFKVKLGKPLELVGPYEVALVELIYPHRRLTVQPGEASLGIHFWSHVPIKTITVGEEKGDSVQYTVETNKIYPKTKKPKAKIVRSVTKSFLPPTVYDNEEQLVNELNKLDRKLKFSLHEGKFSVKLPNRVTRVDMSGRLANLLGFSKFEEPYTIRMSQTAQYKPYWEGSSHSLYIYSSIVDHQLVGDVVAPLLRVVCPETSKLGQTVSEKYIKPYYLPVNSSYIDTIDVQIRTTSGHLFPFLSGNPVVVSLHFRPRSSSD